MAAARRKQPSSSKPPASAVQSPPDACSGNTRRGFKSGLFKIIAALVLPTLLLILLELGLRLVGVGYPTRFFLPATHSGQQVYIENYQFGWRFFGAKAARTPRPTVLLARKNPGTFRVFVFGESAAYGDPRPEFGLPRLLQTMLRARYPEIKFEVINAAMTGINSHSVLPIARDCARHEGDVWVIYMGNNEVVGPFGSGTVFGPRAPSLGIVRANLAIKATRLGQVLAGAVQQGGTEADPAEWQGMTMFLEHRVSQDDPRMARVYENFRRNLQDILETGRKNDAKVVLCNVASNLKDCAPFASVHRTDLTSAELADWNAAYQVGVRSESAGKPAEAIESFQKCAKLDDHFADLHFRWARCALTVGKPEDARAHFVQARDWDALRFRTDSRLNEIIHEVAHDRENQGVSLLDVVSLLESRSSQGIPGDESFHEHVHFNFHGNYVLARAIAEKVAEGLREKTGDQMANALPWLSEKECGQRLAYTEWDQFKAAKSLMLRINDPPFTTQLDAADRYAQLRQDLERLLPATKPGALHRGIEHYRQAISGNTNDWTLQRGLGELLTRTGDPARADAHYLRVSEMIPHDPMVWLELGLLKLQQNEPKEAMEAFDKGLALRADFFPFLNARAVALTSLGDMDGAMDMYRRALRLKHRDTETHLNLALAYEKLGRKEDAQKEVLEALAFGAVTPETMLRLGKVAFTRGWSDAAVTNLSRAVQLNPVDANAHLTLAGMLDSQGKTGEARRHFEEAARLNPELSAAHLGIGVELLREGKAAEAVPHFEEAIRLSPQSKEARLNLGVSLLRQRQIERALREFNEVLRIEPGNVAASKYVQQASALRDQLTTP